MAKQRIDVYRWKVDRGFDTTAWLILNALRNAGRVVEIEAVKDGVDRCLVLKAIVPLPRKVQALITPAAATAREGVHDA